MADIRCPMCGKPNPEDLDTCQFCQARLTPLMAGTPADSGEASTPEADIPDWLRSLQPDDQAAAQPPEISEPPDSQESGDDWLSNLRERSPQTEDTHLEESEDEWLQDEDSQKDEIPDWLASFRAQGGPMRPYVPEEPARPSVVHHTGEETPEWLQRLDQSASAESEAGMGELEPGLDEEAGSVEAASQQAGSDSDSMPEEQAAKPEAEDASSRDSLMEWLSGLEGSVGVSDTKESSAAGPTPGESDWFAELSAGTVPPSQRPPAELIPPSAPKTPAFIPGSDENVPGWLASLDNPTREPEEYLEPASPGDEQAEDEPAELAEELPDWLSGIVSGEPTVDTPSEQGTGSLPDWMVPLDVPSSLIDTPYAAKDTGELNYGWLDQVRADTEPPPPEPETSAQKAGVVAPFTPDSETEIPTLPEGEVPEWLANVMPAEPAKPAEGETGQGLTPAELPTWLEAMRPLETPVPGVVDERDRRVENSGPLSGLRGVLPAEPEAARARKPANYSMRLQVSEAQQANAALWKNQVEVEGEVRPVPARPILTPQHLLRMVIFLALVGVIAWQAFTGTTASPLPEFAPEHFDFYQSINGLPGGVPVLVAVDYEPALAPELEAAASPVLDQLMLKGTYLVLMSTTSSGPAQAERLLRSVNTRFGHFYQGIQQYVNLGYLPGGQAGLAAFAVAPQRALPFAQDGTAVWQEGSLQEVRQLGNFGAIIVITENADTARYWVEQVGPSLDQTPLLMVLSAQAEPMVRPYYVSNPQQVRGLVAGLAGGAAYEQFLPRSGLARRYWDSYSMALGIAGLLLIVGGAINLLATRLRRKPGAGGGGA